MKVRSFKDDGVRRLEFTDCTEDEAWEHAYRMVRNDDFTSRVLDGGTILVTLIPRKEPA